LGEDGLRIMTQLINNVYYTGEWSKECTEVKIIALKKKPKATKCSDHRTFSLITHTAKRVASVLRRRPERKFENVLGENYFAFRRRKAWDPSGMLRRISERISDIDEELCVRFMQ
jgi:hypothetical protein